MKVMMWEPTEAWIMKNMFCDMCGKSCKTPLNLVESSSWEAHWGYGSHHDGESWLCELCESCSEKVKKFIESQGGHIQVGGC